MLEKSRGLVAVFLIIGLFATINTAIIKYETVADALQIMSPLATMFGVILGGIAGFYFNAKAVDAATTAAEQANTEANSVSQRFEELVEATEEFNNRVEQIDSVSEGEIKNEVQFSEVLNRLAAKAMNAKVYLDARKK